MIVVVQCVRVDSAIFDCPPIEIPLDWRSFGFSIATYSQGRIGVGCAIQAYVPQSTRLMWQGWRSWP